MSWYFSYYPCYKNKKENKLYFLGPYNYEGRIKDVLTRSRSFASELYESFVPIKNKEDFSDKMLKDLQNRWGLEDEELEEHLEDYCRGGLLCYCPLDDLPTGDYMKEGYFLNEQIDAYEEDHDYECLYKPLTLTEYTRMLQNEMKFGKPDEKIDEWGEKYIPHSCEDYSFYRYPDYGSKEYEASEIRKMVNILTGDGYSFYLYNEDERRYYQNPDIELGVFLSQG